jgi:hypothetical protein
MAYFRKVRQITRDRPDWPLLIGAEHLLVEAMQAGGNGGVRGGANLFPGLFVALYEATVAGDVPRTQELQQRVLRPGRIYTVGRHASAVIKGLKCALSLLGICDDVLAEPFHRFFAPERKRGRGIPPCLRRKGRKLTWPPREQLFIIGLNMSPIYQLVLERRLTHDGIAIDVQPLRFCKRA